VMTRLLNTATTSLSERGMHANIHRGIG
jgi:hypothetical protein